MAKKARKKTARRKAAKKTVARKATGGSLRRISTGDLQAELKRRSQNLTKLQARRDTLLSEVGEIDMEISVINAAMGVAGGVAASAGNRRGPRAARKAPAAAGRTRRAGGRKRPRNAASLEVSLSKVLSGKTMGVSEAADAVKKAGYKTNSPNFRTIVNQTLIRSDLIKKVKRGAYTAK